MLLALPVAHAAVIRAEEENPEHGEKYEQFYQHKQPELPAPRHIPESITIKPEHGAKTKPYPFKHLQKNEIPATRQRKIQILLQNISFCNILGKTKSLSRQFSLERDIC